MSAFLANHFQAVPRKDGDRQPSIFSLILKTCQMRMALTIHALFGGGAERLMAQLATRWAVEHEVHLITWSSVESDRHETPESVHRVGLNMMHPSANLLTGLVANLHRVKKLRTALEAIRPEFILSFADQMNIVTLEASRKLKVPRWIAEHSNPERQRLSRLWELWRQRVYPRATGAVVLTEAIADYMSRWIAPDRLIVIPPAIPETELVSLDPVDLLSPNRERKLLFVGRLSYEKRVDRLLRVWKLAAEKLPNWKLEIVGDGSARGELESQAAPLDRVHFAGWTDKPEMHFSTADLFVLTSDYEGFPVAVLESLRYGVPCIATDCTSAFQTLNSDGEVVVVGPLNDESTFAKILVDLAMDEVRRDEMCRRSQIKATQYSWKAIGQRWDALLKAPGRR